MTSGADEAAAIRADLAKWVDEVLFDVVPSAREWVRDCWHQHPDAVTEPSACWLEFRRIFASAPPRPGKSAVRRPSLALLPRLPRQVAAGHAPPGQGDHRKMQQQF